jgi:hypothetical protein
MYSIAIYHRSNALCDYNCSIYYFTIYHLVWFTYGKKWLTEKKLFENDANSFQKWDFSPPLNTNTVILNEEI